MEVEAELSNLAFNDSRSTYWRDATWLPVWNFDTAPQPIERMAYDERVMCALPWKRIVLYDASRN